MLACGSSRRGNHCRRDGSESDRRRLRLEAGPTCLAAHRPTARSTKRTGEVRLRRRGLQGNGSLLHLLLGERLLGS